MIFQNVCTNDKLIIDKYFVKGNFILPDINDPIIVSILRLYVKTHVMTHCRSMLKVVSNIQNPTAEQILNLSKKHNFPPIRLAQIIYMKKELPHELMKALLPYDSYTIENHEQSRQESLKFEHKISKLLDNQRIVYMSEEELRQVPSPYTPDFLLLSPLFLFNKTIHWIDAKNYYGANVYLVIKNIQKQGNKYFDAYGYGMFVFNHGFSKYLVKSDKFCYSFI